MIEFVTLLLGLVTGPQAVEVSVGRDVAVVEAFLDGNKVATTNSWPWVLTCDFGSELVPRILEVVATDHAGVETGRARQMVNVPRDRVEVRLALDRGPTGAQARVLLTDIDGRQPRSVRLVFDGSELESSDLGHFQLPDHDLDSPHFLRAEVEMSENEHSSAELVFGGSFGESVDRDLTALLITTSGRSVSASEMKGWFELDGSGLTVAAVEKGPIELVIVRERSPATIAALDEIATSALRQRARARRPIAEVPFLEPRDRVRFALPTGGRKVVDVGTGQSFNQVEQIPVTGDIASFGSFEHIVTDLTFPELEQFVPAQQLTDAVAIAGLAAARSHRRSAVVVVGAGDSKDISRFSPGQVEQYLARLGVPMVVWDVGESNLLAAAGWSNVHHIRDHKAMRLISNDLRKQLDAQSVVWLDGAFLNHRVALTEAGRKLASKAGGPSP